MIKNHKFIIIGEEHYNPLGAIRALGESGIYPDYIAIKGKSLVASKSKYVNKVHFVSNINEGFDTLMLEYSDLHEKPFVITTDDDIQELIDKKYNEINSNFIVFNAGESGRISKYMNKKTILDLAVKHGFAVLPTVAVSKGTIPEGIEYPIITKSISPNDGGWKSDVFICNNCEELKEAYKKIKSNEVIVQRFIEKKNECCLDGFSVSRGKKVFIPIASSYNYNIRGYYSPFMSVYPFSDMNTKGALDRMLSEIGFEGIFSIEFLIDQDGSFYFSEINFRNSTWAYIAAKLGMPLPVLWAESMLSGIINEGWYKPIPENYTAMVEPIDYGKRVLENRCSLADWLIDFKSADCTFYLNENDPEPYYEMVNNWKKLS